MRGWPGNGPEDGRGNRDDGGRGEDRRPPTGKPSLGTWYAKGLATTIPTLVAGGIGLVSTGSAGVAAIVATAVSALSAPAVESWFKGREIKAEQDAAASDLGNLGSPGAMGQTLMTLATVYQLIDEITGRAETCQHSLEEGRAALVTVMGGGNAVPPDLGESYGLNGEAQDDLKRMCSELGQAFAALRRLQASLS